MLLICNCCAAATVVLLLLPQLDADGKREFFCEEAWWDVAAMEPFTPACISDVHAEASDAT